MEGVKGLLAPASPCSESARRTSQSNHEAFLRKARSRASAQPPQLQAGTEALGVLPGSHWCLGEMHLKTPGRRLRMLVFPDIVEFSEAMANAGKTVIVAALDGTFQRKAFGAILNLVPLAESVVKLTAVCMECFREAAYTKRLGTEKEVEVIGGADKYHSVCRLCYFKKPLGQPAGLDSTENKENCPVLGKPGEATGARKLFAPHQILQCSTAN
nr:thymidine kinase, cytosolic isoform X4 [Equus asinus]